jgi:PAS domain S-box-containing protein
MGSGLGNGWLAAIHPEDVKTVEAMLINAIHRQNAFTHEYRLKGKDGQYRWMINSGAPKYNNDGTRDGFIGCVVNIEKRKLAEKAVLDNEKRFRQLADSMPQIVWTANPDGYTDYYNRQWYSIMGAEEIYGDESFVSLLHPDDRERALKEWHSVVASGNSYQVEYRFYVQQPAPGYRWFLARALPIKDESGQIVKWYGTCTDIDDVKRIEQSLRESEQRFRTVADSAPVLVWMSGTDKACFFFNKGWLDFTGRTAEQEMGNGWAEGVHPDDLAGCLKIYTESFDKREEFEMEYRLRRADGTYRWVLDHGIPRYAADGMFLGYIGSCIDIQVQKEQNDELEKRVRERTNEIIQKSEELRHQNEFIQTILDSSVDIIAVVDKDMRYILINNKCQEVYGKTKEEMLGKKMTDIFPATQNSITYKGILEAGGAPARDPRLCHADHAVGR